MEGRRNLCMVCWVCLPCHGMMLLRQMLGGRDCGFAGVLADSLVGGKGCGFEVAVDGPGEGSFGKGPGSFDSPDLGEDKTVQAVGSHLGSCPVGSVAAGVAAGNQVALADSFPVGNPAGNHPGGRSQVVGYIRIRSLCVCFVLTGR